MKGVYIEAGRLDDVIKLLNEIPEFDQAPSKAQIEQRIAGCQSLVLVAYTDERPAGFKIGYARGEGFYSWLGAVHPSFRRQGVATALADHQEAWAKKQGYLTLWMKTRNRFPGMLLMAIKRGFLITDFNPRDQIAEHRIVLRKSI